MAIALAPKHLSVYEKMAVHVHRTKAKKKTSLETNISFAGKLPFVFLM